MNFYIFTYKWVKKYSFNRLLCILPETVTWDLGAERACNGRKHSKTVVALIITVSEILDSIKYLPNGSAPMSVWLK